MQQNEQGELAQHNIFPSPNLLSDDQHTPELDSDHICFP